MEERLKQIIARIEASALSDASKAQLYTIISTGLQTSIWPAIVPYLPQGEADSLLNETDAKARVERMNSILVDALSKDEVMAEIEQILSALLDEVDAALKEESI